MNSSIFPRRIWRRLKNEYIYLFYKNKLLNYFYLLKKKKNYKTQLSVKVTPVEVDLPEPSMQAVNGIEESWDVQDVRSANKFWPIIEVAVSGGSFSFENCPVLLYSLDRL